MKVNDKIAEPVYLKPEEDPRLTIYKEIETYRSKLSEYEQLEKELNQLNLHLNASEAHPNDPNKLSRLKSEKGKAAGNATKRNSHKKIKIYQLQKKYDKVARQYDEKRTNFEKNMENHNKILWEIEDLSSKIQNEKKTSENLKQLTLQIESDLEANSSKIERQVNNLEQSVKTKELCSYQRKKIRDDIKRTRIVIHNITNNLTEDLELSYSDDEEKNIPKSETSLPLIDSPPEQMPLATDLQLWMDKQARRIEASFGKYDTNHERNLNYMNNFYSLKKEMISNELVVKHHKVTIALQTAKIKQYAALAQEFRQNIARRSQIANDLTLRINKLDGERGFIRGRIGIKIEEQRLIRAVNTLLEEDLRRVRDKLGYLNFLKKFVQKRTL